MTKDTKPHKGVSKSNVSASASAATRQQTSSSADRRLDASAASTSTASVSKPPMSARYIDSRLKQFCLR
jgi:hypothetical protein